MKYFIKKYVKTKHKRLIKKYKKILIKLDKHYTHKLNLKREKLLDKIIHFKDKRGDYIYIYEN